MLSVHTMSYRMIIKRNRPNTLSEVQIKILKPSSDVFMSFGTYWSILRMMLSVAEVLKCCSINEPNYLARKTLLHQSY